MPLLLQKVHSLTAAYPITMVKTEGRAVIALLRGQGRQWRCENVMYMVIIKSCVVLLPDECENGREQLVDRIAGN